ncbi:MAG TPA: DNA polymerase/3'-5' exonuclease PolX [Stellaceae bacterium]|nr:DNA polymerase/3'-5' exonuclease PolX [Stellaceae bacterium]
MATGRTHNPEIAQSLDDIADLLELEEANPFRVRAYRNAARVVRSLGKEVGEILADGEQAAKLPGIGADLADKIRTLAATGHLPLLDQLKKKTPQIARELLKLPGLGPKRVRALCDELEVRTLEQLHRAVLDGRVRELPGFGAGIEGKLRDALEAHAEAPPARLKLALAESYVEPLLAHLRGAPGVDKVVVAGSYRRCQETIGDIDILATAKRGGPVIERFTAYDEVAKTLASGTTRATVALRSGLQVDLRVVPAESYGSALHYFTGSKAHNIAIRKLGQQRGLKINEYGVFRGTKRIGGKTEEEVYHSVGLPFIAPELREDRGEIEAAAAGTLPDLVELSDLRGDLHVHSKATDGHNTLEELAEAAKERGYGYIAVTDHSRRLAMTHGLDPRRLRQEMQQIDRVNANHSGITLLKGIEVDILEDGTLDLPDAVLGELDLVVAAVHSKFNLSRQAQTERILRAMDGPHFTILAHPTGRLIGEREPYDVDMTRILAGAKERGCFIELNAHPERLDLTDLHCRMAKEAGVLVSVATDSHRAEELSYVRFGIGQARRGWLEKADVLNTRSLATLRPLLARTMKR